MLETFYPVWQLSIVSPPVKCEFVAALLLKATIPAATPMYSYISKSNPLVYASLLLACVSLLVTTPIGANCFLWGSWFYLTTSPAVYFYINGEKIRMRSKFAQRIAQQREADEEADEKKGGARVHHREVAESVNSNRNDPESARHEKPTKKRRAGPPYHNDGGPMSHRNTPSKRTAYL